ncbi:MAG: hypothetical protein AB1896_09540, partial [Thermodesulfobacteriota bacterium]
VETAARESLLRTAAELGPRLAAGVNAWYRERARAEGLPLLRGGLLDIERRLRLIQFRYAFQDPRLLEPSPLKGLERLSRAGIVGPDVRLVLYRSYSYQWFLANRLSLLGGRSAQDWRDFGSGRLDRKLDLPGASTRAAALIKESRAALAELAHETRKEEARAWGP